MFSSGLREVPPMMARPALKMAIFLASDFSTPACAASSSNVFFRPSKALPSILFLACAAISWSIRESERSPNCLNSSRAVCSSVLENVGSDGIAKGFWAIPAPPAEAAGLRSALGRVVMPPPIGRPPKTSLSVEPGTGPRSLLMPEAVAGAASPRCFFSASM